MWLDLGCINGGFENGRWLLKDGAERAWEAWAERAANVTGQG